MAYAVRYRERAKEEFEEYLEAYPTLRTEVLGWIEEIASSSVRRNKLRRPESGDIIEVLNEALAKDGLSRWAHTTRKWRESGLRTKARAFLAYVMGAFHSPWELRSEERGFTFLGACKCRITADYEVDHVEKMVIFAMFSGLPGQ